MKWRLGAGCCSLSRPRDAICFNFIGGTFSIYLSADGGKIVLRRAETLGGNGNKAASDMFLDAAVAASINTTTLMQRDSESDDGFRLVVHIGDISYARGENYYFGVKSFGWQLRGPLVTCWLLFCCFWSGACGLAGLWVESCHPLQATPASGTSSSTRCVSLILGVGPDCNRCTSCPVVHCALLLCHRGVIVSSSDRPVCRSLYAVDDTPRFHNTPMPPSPLPLPSPPMSHATASFRCLGFGGREESDLGDGAGNHERDWPGTESGKLYPDATDSGGECGVAYRRRFQMPLPSENEDDLWYSFGQ